MIRRSRTSRGFTLVELIVSIAIFMIVVEIAMAAYVSMIAADRKARALNDVVTNLSYVVESMSRSLRVGTGYQCAGGTNCPSGGSSIRFTDENGQTVTYLRNTSNNTIGMCTGSGACSNSSASPLTDSRITVSNLMFYVQGVGTGDGTQPRVVMTMTGTITPQNNATPISFTIQNSATQRYIEL